MLGADLRTSKRFEGSSMVPSLTQPVVESRRALPPSDSTASRAEPWCFQGPRTSRLLAFACAVPWPGVPASHPSVKACTGILRADMSLYGVSPMVPAELSLTVVMGTTQMAFESHVQNHQPSAGPGSPRKPRNPHHPRRAPRVGATGRKPGVYIANRG